MKSILRPASGDAVFILIGETRGGAAGLESAGSPVAEKRWRVDVVLSKI